MVRLARLGKRVMILDEGGNWKGCGTALKMVKDGHQVVLITPDPLVGKELQRTAADYPLRQKLAQVGGSLHPRIRDHTLDSSRC